MDCHFLLQGIFPTRNWTWVSCTAGRFFTIWATKEAHLWQGNWQVQSTNPLASSIPIGKTGWRTPLWREWFKRIKWLKTQLSRTSKGLMSNPWTPQKPSLSLFQTLPSKENSIRNGLLTYGFWVKCFFGFEELKNKHFFPISSNSWPSAEPPLPSAIPQPLNIVGCVFTVCYLFSMLSYGFSLTK